MKRAIVIIVVASLALWAGLTFLIAGAINNFQDRIHAQSFDMYENGPVPVGCCEPGDSLHVIMDMDIPMPTPEYRCAQMGGTLGGTMCWEVDF